MTTILKSELLPLKGESDIVLTRQLVRQVAAEHRFSIVDQTKLVTAASEIARNTVTYGGGGNVLLEVLAEGARTCVRLTFDDKGPGIPNVTLALQDGYTTGSGMGLGLGGARRLCNDFKIETEVGAGTKVTLLRWK